MWFCRGADRVWRLKTPARLTGALDRGGIRPDLQTMFGELYHNRILELAGDIPHLARLNHADGASLKVSRV